jgi:hypothetical protein
LAFANEVRRVARKYWVQTPYKHFPVEPHFVFPLFQYLPSSLQKKVGLVWKYSHPKQNGDDILAELSRLRLLDVSDYKVLFPDAEILKETFFGLTKSLVAVKPRR